MNGHLMACYLFNNLSKKVHSFGCSHSPWLSTSHVCTVVEARVIRTYKRTSACKFCMSNWDMRVCGVTPASLDAALGEVGR